MNMSTMRCCSTWNEPIVAPNCLRVLAYSSVAEFNSPIAADRFRTERGDGAVAAGFQRGDALAFLAEQLAAARRAG